MMKRKFIFLLFTIVQFAVAAQDGIIYGRVVSQNDSPYLGAGEAIMYAEIYDSEFRYVSGTDENGVFSFLLTDALRDGSITIDHIGYLSQVIARLDTVTGPLLIELEYSDSTVNYTSWSTGLYADQLVFDFSEFTELLGEDAVRGLDGNGVKFNIALYWSLMRFNQGIQFGTGYVPDLLINDSIRYRTSRTQYVYSTGYDLVNNSFLQITPRLDYKLYRIRQRRDFTDTPLPLNAYVNERTSDIRFNQYILSPGINIMFKLGNYRRFGNYAQGGIGFYAGYPIRIGNNARLRSSSGKLGTDLNYSIDPINLGVYLAILVNQ